MKICIATDFHLSYKQYGLEEREQDFYKQYEIMIDKIIEEKPQVFLILGDIFDTPYPKPISIKKFEEGLNKLQEHNIKTYGIVGNHTMIQRKNYYPIDNIFDDKYTLLNEKGIVIDDIFIGGLNYHPKTHDIKPLIDKLYEEAKGCKVKILMLHQILKQDQNIGYDYDEDELGLDRFDYVFLGHLHKRTTRHKGNTTIHYVGSLNSCNVTELIDEMRYGRGYTVLDIKPFVEMYHMALPPQREYIQYNLKDGGLNDKFIDDVIESLNGYDVKPVVMLKTMGNCAKDVYEFSKKLEDCSLIVKQNISLESQETSLGVDDGGFGGGVEKMLEDSFDEDWKSDLAIGLFRALSCGDVDGALELADEVYVSEKHTF